jgi:hypothetical protein
MTLADDVPSTRLQPPLVSCIALFDRLVLWLADRVVCARLTSDCGLENEKNSPL